MFGEVIFYKEIGRSLFSIFDPTAFLGLKLNWLACFISLIVIPTSLWLTNNQIQSFFGSIYSYLYKEFRSLIGSRVQPGALLASISLFFYILSINILGLLPFCFPPTSHLVFSVSLALPLWLGHIISS